MEDGRMDVNVEIVDLPETRPGNISHASFSLETLITVLIIIACSSALLSYVLIALEYWYLLACWTNRYDNVVGNCDDI